MLRLVLKALCFSVAIFSTASISAQNWKQTQKVLPPIDPTSPIGGQSDRVGWAVAADANVMVTGAPDSDVNGTSSGAAYVYERVAGTWEYTGEIFPVGGNKLDNFGYCVDVSGNRIAVGAPGDSPGATSSGSVFIFEKIGSEWTQTAVLSPSDPASFDQFGYSVSLDGDRLIAGSFEDDDNGFSSGSAYIFEFNAGSWSQVAKLIASDGLDNDYFGISVSISDTIAVCGAYLGNAGGSDRGAAYVFYKNNGLWSQQQKLIAPDGLNGDQFGVSVAVSGSRIAVGANYRDDGGNNAGAVYTYSLSGLTFTFSQKLLASDAAANDFFGHHVNLKGTDLIIGGWANDDLGNASGSAYVFTFAGSWAQQQKLLAPDGAAQDYFGYAVDISENQVIIGGRGDDDSGNDSGSIYIFSRDLDVWTFNFKGTANDMIDDPSLDLFGSHVALDGMNALIGSYGDDDQGVSAGSVRFYRFDGNSWVDQGKFYSSDIAQQDFFGFRVALSGNTALVSSYGDDDFGDFSGAVYVFERIGGVWVQVQKLISSDAAPFDDFGYSLAIDGDYAVISSYLDDDFGNFSGSAYTFKRTAGIWIQTQKLLPNAGAANQQFGFDVDIHGTQIVIGARNDGTSVSFGGAAYIYERTGETWAQTAKIKPNDNSANKVFGSSVSISQGIVLVGALGDNAGESNSGAAYVFEKVAGNWTQKAKLKPDTIIAGEYFGYSVDNVGKKLLIGAYRGKNASNVASGSAFIFDGFTGPYLQAQKLTANEGVLNDYFGIHLALDGENALIGAQFDDDNGDNAGAAYFYADCADLDNNGVCDFAETTITNNECAGATELTPSIFGESDWYQQTLFGATQSEIGCTGVADDDVWFRFIAISPHDVIIAQDPSSSFNAVIELFSECGGASLGCFDAYGDGAAERALPGNLVPGQEYFYRVYDAGIALSPTASIRTQVKTFEDCKLRAPYCGASDMQLIQSIYCERDDLGELYANPVVGVYGYGFRFQEQGGGLDVSIQHPSVDGFYLQLSNVPGLQYGKTYNVTVQHLIGITANGFLANYWSGFGTVCTLALQVNLPTTSVVNEYCSGAVDFYLADQLQAYFVSGADKYRFTFTGTGGTDNGVVKVKETVNYALFLHTVGYGAAGLRYGNTYQVTVQSRINGVWSGMGLSCNINMSMQPPDTEMRAEFCNGTYLFPQSNYVLAQQVFGATQYEWRFTPSMGGSSHTQMTLGVSFAFHLTSLPFVSGTTYNFEVRALAGGVWGDYGNSCMITIQANPDFQGPETTLATKNLFDAQLKIYPNPVADFEFILSMELQGGEDNLQIQIYDISGRLLFAEQLASKGNQVNHKVILTDDIAPGQYVLRVISKDLSRTVPLVIE